MLSNRRHELILKELRLRGSLRTVEFAKSLGVSEMTLRRDLSELQVSGSLLRVHGGAVDNGQLSSPMRGRGRQPSASAPRPSSTTRATIGMVIPSANYYFPEVIRGAKESAAALECRLMLAVSEYSPEQEREQIKRLLGAKVEGLLVTTSGYLEEDSETYKLLLSAKVPVVVVERSLDHLLHVPRLESVGSDHVAGAGLAIQHFAELGHERVGLLTGELVTGGWVIDGYKRSIARMGLQNDAPVDSYLTSDSGSKSFLLNFLNRCKETGTRAAVVLPDQLAFSLVEVASEIGIEVPQDFEIIAYDDEIAALGEVPLTAISPPKYDIGWLALSTCFDRITLSRRGDMALRRIKLLPEIRIRRSSTQVLGA